MLDRNKRVLFSKNHVQIEEEKISPYDHRYLWSVQKIGMTGNNIKHVEGIKKVKKKKNQGQEVSVVEKNELEEKYDKLNDKERQKRLVDKLGW